MSKKKSYDKILPVDKVLSGREKTWLDLFERYSIDPVDSDGGMVVKSMEDYFPDCNVEEDDRSDSEFEDNEKEDEKEMDIDVNKCIEAIHRRTQKWDNTGFCLQMKSYLFNETFHMWNMMSNHFINGEVSVKNESSIFDKKMTTMTIREYTLTLSDSTMFGNSIFGRTSILGNRMLNGYNNSMNYGFNNSKMFPMPINRRINFKPYKTDTNNSKMYNNAPRSTTKDKKYPLKGLQIQPPHKLISKQKCLSNHRLSLIKDSDSDTDNSDSDTENSDSETDGVCEPMKDLQINEKMKKQCKTQFKQALKSETKKKSKNEPVNKCYPVLNKPKLVPVVKIKRLHFDSDIDPTVIMNSILDNIRVKPMKRNIFSDECSNSSGYNSNSPLMNSSSNESQANEIFEKVKKNYSTRNDKLTKNINKEFTKKYSDKSTKSNLNESNKNSTGKSNKNQPNKSAEKSSSSSKSIENMTNKFAEKYSGKSNKSNSNESTETTSSSSKSTQYSTDKSNNNRPNESAEKSSSSDKSTENSIGKSNQNQTNEFAEKISSKSTANMTNKLTEKCSGKSNKSNSNKSTEKSCSSSKFTENKNKSVKNSCSSSNSSENTFNIFTEKYSHKSSKTNCNESTEKCSSQSIENKDIGNNYKLSGSKYRRICHQNERKVLNTNQISPICSILKQNNDSLSSSTTKIVRFSPKSCVESKNNENIYKLKLKEAKNFKFIKETLPKMCEMSDNMKLTTTDSAALPNFCESKCQSVPYQFEKSTNKEKQTSPLTNVERNQKYRENLNIEKNRIDRYLFGKSNFKSVQDQSDTCANNKKELKEERIHQHANHVPGPKENEFKLKIPKESNIPIMKNVPVLSKSSHLNVHKSDYNEKVRCKNSNILSETYVVTKHDTNPRMPSAIDKCDTVHVHNVPDSAKENHQFHSQPVNYQRNIKIENEKLTEKCTLKSLSTNSIEKNAKKTQIIIYSPSMQSDYVRNSDNQVSIPVQQTLAAIGKENMKMFFGMKPFRRLRCDANRKLIFMITEDNVPKIVQL